MIRPIRHHNYTKMVDELLWISSTAVVKMNVNLCNYKNVNYHKEFKTNGDNMTMKRSFDSYISIETTYKATNKEYIILGISEIYLLNMALDRVFLWFNSPEYKDLFKMSNGVLKLMQSVTPVILNNLPLEKSITFEPAVYFLETGNVQEPGILMTIGSEPVIININKLIALKTILSQVNLYLYAQNMINYLGRPEYGANLVEFDNDKNDISENNKGVECRTGRTIGNKNKSFFDK